MNQIFRTGAAVLLAALPLWASAQKTVEVTDPSGKVKVSVTIGKDIAYAVTHEDDVMIAPSPISMTLEDGTVFGQEPRLRKVSRKSEDQVIHPPLYKKQSIRDCYNEMTLSFRGGYDLVFRAYGDGAAYRFVSHRKAPFKVMAEQATFNLPDNPKVYAATPKGREVDGKESQYHSSFQNTYRHVALSEWDKQRLAFLPVLAEATDGKKVCITEADLLDYTGMYLKVASDNRGWQGDFAAYPKDVSVEVRGLKGMVKTREPYIARVEGETKFPWRVVVVSERDADLLCNDMVYKLATPAAEGDYSWVKPGKVAWDWWNDWNIYGVDFRAVYSEPMSQGTRCRQLAAYVIFDSPLNMLCDAPTNYLKEEECARFISAIPTVWDETKAIDGRVGEYILMARRKSDTWYVGGLTDWNARDVLLDFAFLGEGAYEAEIFQDGPNADRVGKDYQRKVMRIPADRKLRLHMAPGGGFALKIRACR